MNGQLQLFGLRRSASIGRCLKSPTGGRVTWLAHGSRDESAPGPTMHYRQWVIFDFRYRDALGKWKSLGHRKGLTRDAAFASLEKRSGPNSATEYMSRPRDGRSRSWDLFRRPGEALGKSETGRTKERFHLIFKGVLDKRVIAQLERRGVYWRPRSNLNPSAKHDKHFLIVEAENGRAAVEQARDLIQDAGGDASGLSLLGSKTE
jgi:hypothetical protein